MVFYLYNDFLFGLGLTTRVAGVSSVSCADRAACTALAVYSAAPSSRNDLLADLAALSSLTTFALFNLKAFGEGTLVIFEDGSFGSGIDSLWSTSIDSRLRGRTFVCAAGGS